MPYTVNIAAIKGKMGERDYSKTRFAAMLKINRNTLSLYLKEPEKIPYDTLSKMADVLQISQEEAGKIFFAKKLTNTQEGYGETG